MYYFVNNQWEYRHTEEHDVDPGSLLLSVMPMPLTAKQKQIIFTVYHYNTTMGLENCPTTSWLNNEFGHAINDDLNTIEEFKLLVRLSPEDEVSEDQWYVNEPKHWRLP